MSIKHWMDSHIYWLQWLPNTIATIYETIQKERTHKQTRSVSFCLSSRWPLCAKQLQKSDLLHTTLAESVSPPSLLRYLFFFRLHQDLFAHFHCLALSLMLNYDFNSHFLSFVTAENIYFWIISWLNDLFWSQHSRSIVFWLYYFRLLINKRGSDR